MATELKLPDVGDNIEKGTIVTILVNLGDTVTEGQPVVELETDKAVVEVPSSAAGTEASPSIFSGDITAAGGVQPISETDRPASPPTTIGLVIGATRESRSSERPESRSSAVRSSASVGASSPASRTAASIPA